MATDQLPAVWSGQAADAATGALTSSAKELETDTALFTAASKLLTTVADSLRSAHQEHSALQQYLLDLQNKADALPPDAATSPVATDLATQASEAVQNAAKLLTNVQTSDEETAKKLTSITSGPFGPVVFLTAANGDQRKPIDEILREYQVTPDPDGMVTFPDGPMGWLADQLGFEPKTMTAGEASLLTDLGVAGIKDAYDIYERAQASGADAFGGQGTTDGHGDAFRHTYWNALLTQRFGPEWTESYTTAHERLPQDQANASTVEAMDLYNNEVGRNIAQAHPDAGPEELARHVEEAVRNGDVLVHDQQGNLKYSDQVEIGQSGKAQAAPDTGGHTPREPDYHWSGGYNPGNDADSYGTTDGNY
ncbi:hypothetical protein SAMN05660874_01584 [Saccharopolyspora flava]|uniref:DUF6973 domain-containing protein n=2 Tax=Saccharopolyspora flava TaxID=95161 RepID=A0A1I6QM28_9PSEU|nr:hypothetical protein SAMN05660874_01584 [Saccharopolyspora flava]